MKPRLACRALLVLAAIGAIAALVPTLAAAEALSTGPYHGADGVSFVVGHTEHGSPVIESAGYHAHSGFERVLVHSGSFETCARARINSILFRDYCIHGTFGAPGHASGTVKVFQGAHGHRPANPQETHHWSATIE
jgi:hypothetical protein